ncbi:MAG: hypothetical protein WEB30_07085, partial [Cyclobacteriaceae bacterium]
LEDRTEKKEADVEDTMALIQRTVPKNAWQTERIAQKLKGRNLEETCSNIWHFVYEHIQYKRDEDGVEQVRSPRRTWWERQTGVDCDCYTEFICSILFALKIPCFARITKYPKAPPEIPRWQHVYPIVPRNGQLNGDLKRGNYIAMDCVKDEYDSEQPFLESKDYDMRLEYLDGIDQEETGEDEEMREMLGIDDSEPDNVDLADLAALYDDEELGNIFKKIGGAVKKVAKKVGTVVKKVADKIGDGVRFLNRYLNPATILLRNGFLLAMKVNLLNVSGRLRYAYLTDAQATAKGMNLDSLKKLRAVKDRAETVYWQAGGRKENLKKGILSGKGNKDKKVPLSGLDGLDEVYADMDEYRIIHSDVNDLNDLGDLGDLGVVTAASVAAATGAVAAIGAALKQVKGLFTKDAKAEQSFQSETDNASDTSAMLQTSATAEEDQVMEQQYTESTPAPSYQTQPTYNETAPKFPAAPNSSASANAALPGADAVSRRATTDVTQTSENTAIQSKGDAEKGFVQKTTEWVKQNPGKTLLIAGGVAGGTFLLVKALQSKPKNNSLSGLPSKRKKKRKSKKGKSRPKKSKVANKILL